MNRLKAVLSLRLSWRLIVAFAAGVAIILGVCFSLTWSTVGLTKDAVTNLPWYWYRKPLMVEYWQAEQPDHRVLGAASDAELILRELRAALPTAKPLVEDSWVFHGIMVNVRTGDGAILLSMDGSTLDGLFHCTGRVAVPTPSETKGTASGPPGTEPNECPLRSCADLLDRGPPRD